MESGILKGALWSVLMRFTVRGLGVISLLILARIFTPEEFGLVAKAVLFKEVLELFTQVGIEAAIIRNKNATKDDYDSAWTLTVFRGLIIGAILLFSSTGIANFFSAPLLSELIALYAISIVIKSFTNIGVVDLRKYMKFDLDFKYNLIIKISEFTPTILIAIYYQSVWAFPIGVFVGSVIGTLISYLFSPFRPEFGLKRFGEFFHFGKWMLLHEISAAISTKFDTFLLGKYGTNSELGVYTVANEIATLPINEIALPVGRASLPGLSRITDEKELKKLNTNTLAFTLSLAIPASFGISIMSYELVTLLLGEKWQSAILLIEILAFIGPATVISALSISIMVVKSKVRELALFSFLSFLIRSTLIVYAYLSYQLVGLCLAVVTTGFLRSIGFLLLQNTFKILDFKLLAQQTIRPTLSAFIMYISIFMFKEHTDINNLAVDTAINIILGAFIYTAGVYTIWYLTGMPKGLESFLLSKIFKKK